MSKTKKYKMNRMIKNKQKMNSKSQKMRQKYKKTRIKMKMWKSMQIVRILKN